MAFRIFAALFLSWVLFSCRKWEDTKGPSDDRLKKPYCNDPEAVNYNWDFPGTPDNSVCLYPFELFVGDYTFRDSVYGTDNILDTSKIATVNFSVHRSSNSKIIISGFCGNQGSFSLTADRYYKASVDSTFADSVLVYPGQPFCTAGDTVTGSIARLKDTTDVVRLYIDFTIRGDTLSGIRYHRGTAFKL